MVCFIIWYVIIDKKEIFPYAQVCTCSRSSWLSLVSFFFLIYLAALRLSCGMWDLCMWCRLSSCGAQAPEHAGSVVVAQAELLQNIWDLSSLTRDWTHIPCVARQILYYWTTREVLFSFLDNQYLECLIDTSSNHFFKVTSVEVPLNCFS